MTNPVESQFIVAFSLLPEIGPVCFRKIKKAFGSFEKAWESSESQFATKSGFDQKLLEKIATLKKKVLPEKEWSILQETQIKLLTEEDEKFPTQLKEISSPPFLLFIEGNIDLLSSKQLGVVGPRLPTKYGKIVTEKIVSGIVRAGLTITSGMAYGIDSVSHSMALESGGKTIAVLGAGIFEAKKNFSARKMAESIISEGGTIVSEYHPTTGATRFTFPARNRIVSGLSLGVLVIEAGEKSGTLITARNAIENNREIFAVPGSIFSDKSIGTNNLLKQGAHLVSSPSDILEVLNFHTTYAEEKKSSKITFEDKVEKQIYSKLSFDPIHIDALSKHLDIPPSQISTTLSMLELKGFVKNVGGGSFIRS